MSIVTPSTCIKKQKAGCQDLQETWDWGWDASRQMRKRPGDSVSSVDWTVPPELSAGTSMIVGNVFWIPISNLSGLVGDTFPLLAKVTTVKGQVMRLRIDITLQDITA